MAIAATAAAQSPRTTAKVITWNPQGSGEIFVGILGEIARPGVYRLESRSLSLQNVIQRAGGLTDDASGTVRVIRQDRVVESLFFSPNSFSPLLAGDLLVVESRRAQAAITGMYEANPRDRAAYAQAANAALAATDPSGVQLAFVNVLDRPVIVKIKHENARLAHVVQMLDQPIELAQAIRVIGPDRLLSPAAAAPSDQATLSSGSVLVFPQNAINRLKLPTLPMPYDSDIATGAIPSLIGGPTGQSAELRNVGQLPPLVARQAWDMANLPQPPAGDSAPPTLPGPAAPAAAPTVAPAAPAPPVGGERLEIPAPAGDMPLVSSPPRIATIPFSGQPRITSSSQLTGPAPESHLPAEAVGGPAAEPGQAPRPPQAEIDPSLDDIPEEPPLDSEAAPAAVSLGHMLGIAALMGLLVGTALLARRHLSRSRAPAGLDAEIDAALHQQAATMTLPEEPAGPALPVAQTPMIADAGLPASSTPPAATSAWFDQLLANQLTIREEPPKFPDEITLQGRIVPPPVFRVDPAAAQLPKPHFSLGEARTQEAAGPASEVDSEQLIDEFDIAHGSRPARPHFLRRRTGQGAAAAKTQSSETATSPTPVTNALRQLQGGPL